MRTYRESTELASTTLAPNSVDLRQLAGNTKSASTGLQIGHGVPVNESLVEEQRIHGSRHDGNESGSGRGPASKGQDKDTNRDILNGDESTLAERAEGELVPHAVGQSDKQTSGFEGIGHKGDTGRGARVDELQDLGDLDDSTGAHDGNTEGLRDSQGCTGRIFDQAEVEKQGGVAGCRDQRDDRIVHRLRKSLDDRLQERLERVHNGLLEDIHDGVSC